MSRTTLVLAVVAVLAAGCGGNATGGRAGPAGTSSPPATSSSAPLTTSVPATTTTSPPPAGTTTTQPPVATRSADCKVADLTVSLSGEDGAMGTLYRGLVFTNTGRRTCTIQGFPGVSFVAGDGGRQVGRAAAWVGPKGPVITLKPGMAATAPLGFVNIGAFDPSDCRPTPVQSLRVYPPHDTAAAFVPFPTTACAGTPPSNHLKVLTVHEGSQL